MSDIIDRLMKEKESHVSYLKDLFAEMQAAGFDDIRIKDPDLDPMCVQIHGADAVIYEMFQIDEPVNVRALYPRTEGEVPPYDEPHRTTMVFILENSAWESVADYTIPCEAVDEKLTEIIDRLGDKYALPDDIQPEVEMRRVWFNQPSTHQPYHHLHGKVGIADMGQPDSSTTVYFTEGGIHSMTVPKDALTVVKISGAED